jgi:prepilin-type N-terminal cleavage/methylation domain-containing protein
MDIHSLCFKFRSATSSRLGFSLIEMMVAVAVASIFILFLTQIFLGQTRLDSRQLENRSFLQLASFIQHIINDVDLCRNSFSDFQNPVSNTSIIFDKNPPTLPQVSKINRVIPAVFTPGAPLGVPTRHLIVKLNDMYDGNIWIQDLSFTKIPGAVANQDISPPPGMAASCSDKVSGYPLKVLNCTTYLANLRLTAYTGVPNKVVPLVLELKKGQRKLVQNFPVNISVNSKNHKIIACGDHLANISPQICYQLGKKFFDPTRPFPHAWCY